MAPVIRQLKQAGDGVETFVCATAQHRQMLDQVLVLFGIRPDIDLNLMEERQTLASFTARAITAVHGVVDTIRPDIVLVQGDTTTAFAAALAAFYRQVPVGHVEAGLRTSTQYCPFPEEINRRLIGSLAAYHFAPTESTAAALLREGVDKETIFVTGNPVVDALKWIVAFAPSPETIRFLESVGIVDDPTTSASTRTILVTAHRRENHGDVLAEICLALRSIVERNENVQIVYPVHLNPEVQDIVGPTLGGRSRIHLVAPLPYSSFVHLMQRSHLVLTDSGGLQEEAPALGKPVLVMRRETERVEGLIAGSARLVGTSSAVIVEEVERLLRDDDAYQAMATSTALYGDGHAAERISAITQSQLRHHDVRHSTIVAT